MFKLNIHLFWSCYIIIFWLLFNLLHNRSIFLMSLYHLMLCPQCLWQHISGWCVSCWVRARGSCFMRNPLDWETLRHETTAKYVLILTFIAWDLKCHVSMFTGSSERGEVCSRFVKHITQLPYTAPHTECVYFTCIILFWLWLTASWKHIFLRVINVLSKTRIHTHFYWCFTHIS